MEAHYGPACKCRHSVSIGNKMPFRDPVHPVRRGRDTLPDLSNVSWVPRTGDGAFAPTARMSVVMRVPWHVLGPAVKSLICVGVDCVRYTYLLLSEWRAFRARGHSISIVLQAVIWRIDIPHKAAQSPQDKRTAPWASSCFESRLQEFDAVDVDVALLDCEASKLEDLLVGWDSESQTMRIETWLARDHK